MKRSFTAIIAMISALAVSGVQHRTPLRADASAMERNVFFRGRFASRGATSLPPPAIDLFKREVSESRGSTVSLDQLGYDEIVRLHSRAEMVTFMKRTLDNEGLRAKDNNTLEQIARYYDGECMTQNYSVLVAELNTAAEPYKCHDAWTERTNPMESNATILTESDQKLLEQHKHGWNLHLDESNPVIAPAGEYAAAANNNSDDAMKDFIKGVVEKMGGAVVDEHPLGDMVASYEGQSDEYAVTRLLNEMRAIGDLPDGSAWIKYGGEYASLSNDGYNAVATGHERGEMLKFVMRVIASQGLKVRHEGGLNGFLPWYNGMCSTQSYDAMVKELRSAATAPTECGGGWVEPVTL